VPPQIRPRRTPRAAVPALVTALVLIVSTVALTMTPSPSAAATRAQVVKAQKRLNALHCNAGPADGRAGAHTRSAVIRFQSRHGMAQTGDLTATVRSRLHSAGARRCDRRPVPAHTGKGRRIVISQAQNWIWVIGPAGAVRKQGGIVDNPGVLRKGGYATGSYCGRPARVRLNQSGAVWMDRFIRFAPCGIGTHRIPRYKSTGRQMHPDWYLGTNLARSHGCIRLRADVARYVWDFTAGKRTVVKVI